MFPRWSLMILLSTSLVASGCIGPIGEEPQELEIKEIAPVLVSATESMGASISGPQLLLDTEVLAGPWHLEMPATIESLEAEADWAVDHHDLELRVTSPTGGSVSIPKEDGQASYVADHPTEGTYTFEIVGKGLILEDTVTVDLTYAWLEASDLVATPDTVTQNGAVRLERVGDRWQATIVRTTSAGEVDDLFSLDVSTFNGPIVVEKTSGPRATATLTSIATADTEERATQLVRGIAVTLDMSGAALKAHARDGNDDRARNENVGAHVSLQVPSALTGELRTSNGKIDLDGLDLQDLKARTSNGAIDLAQIKTTGLDLDTSNGKISGSLIASGDVKVRTSNGPIDLAFTPTEALDLDLRTSNGKIALDLKEGADIGYRLDARTSNGKISEDMDDAQLSGEKDNEKRLETSGYSGKAHQVSGEVRTSNGKIHFDGN